MPFNLSIKNHYKLKFKTIVILIITGILLSCSNTEVKGDQQFIRKNVLFLPVDDLNDWIGALGNEQAITPNMDRLAKRGTLFSNAHCSAPVCNPSRASILSGMRPSTLGIYNNGQPLNANYPDVVTIPRHFKNNGYKTFGGGKILHEQIGFAIPEDWDYYFLWDENNRKNGWWGHYSWPPDPQPDPRPAKPISEHTNRN